MDKIDVFKDMIHFINMGDIKTFSINRDDELDLEEALKSYGALNPSASYQDKENSIVILEYSNDEAIYEITILEKEVILERID